MEPDPSGTGIDRKQDESNLSKYGPLLSSGLELAVSVGIMCVVGYFLDRHFGTTPWLMVVGIFFGAAAGFYLFVKTISSVEQSTEEKGKSDKNVNG